MTPDEMVELLPPQGAMLFEDFVEVANAAKAPARMWLRLKHQGKLFTWIDSEGHKISRNPQPSQVVTNG